MAEDAIYISLNFEDPELKRVMPWTGTSSGPESFISTFTRVATYWTIEAFEISDLFGSAEDVAVFGSFTYLSVSLGQAVRSPFSIHATVKDGKIAFFQFMEDVRHRPVLLFERGMGNPDATRRADFPGVRHLSASRLIGQIMSRNILWRRIGPPVQPTNTASDHVAVG